MFSFFKTTNKKRSQIEEFYEAVYVSAFPRGTEQIEEEAELLRRTFQSKYTGEEMKELLLQTTCYLYLGVMDSKDYSTQDLVGYLIKDKDMSGPDALILANHCNK
jgi:hypothetical protein